MKKTRFKFERRKSWHENNFFRLAIVLVIIGMISLPVFMLFRMNFVGFVVWQVDNQSSFDEGMYTNVFYNSTGGFLQLNATETSGTYTSVVFDAESNSTWNNMSWTETLATQVRLIVVDGQADIWKSTDTGVSWTLVKDDYNNGESNNPLYMLSDSDSYLYVIEDDDDVWQSTDVGATWTKVNDDYNGEGEHIKAGAVDSDDNIFIIEGDEDVWKSIDSGTGWTKVSSNFNSDNGNSRGMAAIGTILYIVDAQSDIWKSINSGANWTLVKDDYNAGEGNLVAGYMLVDGNNYLYVIEDDDDIWRSADLGYNWTKINDDYNGEGEHAKTAVVDINDNFFIIEGDEDVWVSSDSGSSWTKAIINFNGDNGNSKGMTALLLGTDLTFQAKSCELANCSDGSFSGSYTETSGENLSVSANRYFQYQASFNSDDSGITSELYNVSIDYTVLSSEPSDSETPVITLISPANNTVDSDGDMVFSYNVTDSSNIANCSLIINNEIKQTDWSVAKNMTQEFILNDLSNGNYMWEVGCTDSNENEGSSETRQFSVEIQEGVAPSSPPSDSGGGGSICTPNWECDSWGSCVNSEQTRICTDRRNCGKNTNKPAETQECEYVPINTEPKIPPVLFDISVLIPQEYKEITPEQTLLTSIELFNLGTDKRADVKLEYMITDEFDNIILEQTETVAVETQVNLVRYFDLPSGLEEGRYKVFATILYGDEQEAVAQDSFFIKKETNEGLAYIYYLLAIFITSLLLLVIILKVMPGIRKHLLERKIKEKVDTAQPKFVEKQPKRRKRKKHHKKRKL